MATIFLSGVGGSSNWLPFLLPIVAIIAIVKSRQLIAEAIKKRRLVHQDKLTSHAGPSFEDAQGQAFSDEK